MKRRSSRANLLNCRCDVDVGEWFPNGDYEPKDKASQRRPSNLLKSVNDHKVVYVLGCAQNLADLLRLEQTTEVGVGHLRLGQVEVLLLLGRGLPRSEERVWKYHFESS